MTAAAAAAASAGHRPLTMTYRLQFGEDLGFDAAADLVPHLERLGVSHVYASPIAKARPGSTHGYDVIDPTVVSPVLGGREALERFVERLHAHGMGLILDIVPNHMAAHPDNAAWVETLELGPSSPSAAVFDFDWSLPQIDLPRLEADLATCLATGSLTLRLDASRGRVLLVHHDTRLPLRPRTVATLIGEAADGDDDGDLRDAAGAWGSLDGNAADAATVQMTRARLGVALAAAPDAAGRIERRLAALAEREQPRLLAMLDDQHWRVDDWRSRSEAIGYRRFFEIDDLVGVRVEDPAVFDLMHALPIDLVRSGLVDGLRVDHIDGLADPAAYAATLRRAVGNRATVHVEKILIGEEDLRPWPVDGTTGYETLNWINGLFVDRAGYDRLVQAAREDVPDLADPARVYGAKREMLDRAFRPDLLRLSALAANALGENDASAIEEAVAALACAFPVYRSYLVGDHPADGPDLALLNDALEAACREAPDHEEAIERVARLLAIGKGEAATAFRVRFQQFTGALMAKGYEDTELYRSVALASANEVGGEIVAPALSPDQAHAHFAARQRDWPRALTPLSTHDTKRSGDVRARLDVLTEEPDRWLSTVERWREMTAKFVTDGVDGRMPDRLDQSIIFQALAGAWPIDSERLSGFVVKALREAKRRSDWIDPNEDYEKAAVAFATALVDDPAAEAFRSDFTAYLPALVRAGRANSLAQTVIQMTAPGVPDLFQGTERFDLSLVDPDNRRPIDWARLSAADFDAAPDDVRDDVEGLSKTSTIAALGALRRQRPSLFEGGAYVPVEATRDGAASGDVFAFARTDEAGAVLTVAALRGRAAENGLLAETALALPEDLHGTWQDVVSARPIVLGPNSPLSALLSPGRPAAVLLRT
ncbi:malto-oligosyltrehalose synthase [Pseudoxanthobacter sp. M-2]|uniref:malto-oligosyltrehalose synthase n=1 Tax=Pseudoxanthobacter sp. M-2 TaxID=3078754 RepID=UPI0038FC5B84